MRICDGCNILVSTPREAGLVFALGSLAAFAIASYTKKLDRRVTNIGIIASGTAAGLLFLATPPPPPEPVPFEKRLKSLEDVTLSYLQENYIWAIIGTTLRKQGSKEAHLVNVTSSSDPQDLATKIQTLRENLREEILKDPSSLMGLGIRCMCLLGRRTKRFIAPSIECERWPRFNFDIP